MKLHKGRTAEQLWEALERAELRNEQNLKLIALQKEHISQLESIVLRVRNCVTPRTQQRISAEQEAFTDETSPT